MLVLSRKIHERLIIGNDIAITIERVSGQSVTLSIEAPPHVPVLREELLLRAKSEATATSQPVSKPTAASCSLVASR
jgi:carbon storage regulator